ncbi:Ppx/GppA phosphatase family protein [Vallicoccus soli]|uniref:Ppx/GppA family phosphatase n=1 Tax=Vallicoccus soli TaxID=2339232 RepID=A0A3A3ZA09_9ACTN|nr:Ppx/GppA phosphatase family protein [Vallicoccus soli]RJK97926.1 Ppx/GppA family phosphatase [Vallicoccus soli]
MRVAAVDCGTNSIRLLVAEATGDPAAPLADLHREMRVVRLGQGVDRTGRFAPEALERTLAACRDYAEVVRGLGAGAVRFVATSATRDAQDRGAFVAGVRAALGVEPEVVSGEEEARLSFLGATGELAAAGLPGPYLAVDIGGGSTEFVLGDGEVTAARSVDVGCVRMTERHLHDDPPTPAQVAAARADVEAAVALAGEAVPLRAAGTLVGLAGSVTTVTAMALDLPAYDSAWIHHARVPAGRVHEVAGRLLAMPRRERAALPFMHPGRVDVIGAGALVLSVVVERTGAAEVVASEHDILDGIALDLLG